MHTGLEYSRICAGFKKPRAASERLTAPRTSCLCDLFCYFFQIRFLLTDPLQFLFSLLTEEQIKRRVTESSLCSPASKAKHLSALFSLGGDPGISPCLRLVAVTVHLQGTRVLDVRSPRETLKGLVQPVR